MPNASTSLVITPNLTGKIETKDFFRTAYYSPVKHRLKQTFDKSPLITTRMTKKIFTQGLSGLALPHTYMTRSGGQFLEARLCFFWK
jgi:hypothetical protein